MTMIRHGAVTLLLDLSGKSDDRENRQRAIGTSNLSMDSRETAVTEQILPVVMSLAEPDSANATHGIVAQQRSDLCRISLKICP